jgi:mannose-6-phosphate isomerase-like protein (cupin superfamily)
MSTATRQDSELSQIRHVPFTERCPRQRPEPGGTMASVPDHSFDLSQTFIHLGVDPTATPLSDFEWSPDYLEAYGRRFAEDGDRGRLVCVLPQTDSWDSWERHPAGEEVVFLISGRVDVVQEIDGEERVIPLRPGEALINPPGVWHTARVHEPGVALFITPGRGTEARPLS